MSSARALADRLWADDAPARTLHGAAGVNAHHANAPTSLLQPSVDFVNDWLKRRGIAKVPLAWDAYGSESTQLELLRVFSDLIVAADSEQTKAESLREQLAKAQVRLQCACVCCAA